MIKSVLFYMSLVSLLLILKWELLYSQFSLWRAESSSIRHIGGRELPETWVEWSPVFSQLHVSTFQNMATTVEEVCPSVEDLTRQESADPLPCPTQGCSRVFHNRPCLRMHLIKTHRVASNSEEKQLYVRGQSKRQVEKHFYCPVKHCVRGQGTKRPFPRMSQLKQVIHWYFRNSQESQSTLMLT